MSDFIVLCFARNTETYYGLERLVSPLTVTQGMTCKAKLCLQQTCTIGLILLTAMFTMEFKGSRLRSGVVWHAVAFRLIQLIHMLALLLPGFYVSAQERARQVVMSFP